jgi:hypothetical protein
MSAPASPLTERTQAILLRRRATSAASDVQGFGRLILAGRAALQCDGSIVGVGSIICELLWPHHRRNAFVVGAIAPSAQDVSTRPCERITSARYRVEA